MRHPPRSFAMIIGVVKEKCLEKKALYLGKAVNFYRDLILLPDGKRAIREYLDHPGAVAVLPLLDRKTAVLVRQYRYPVGETTYEIPAGKLDGKESRLACLRRELREETGYSARKIGYLLSYWPTPAFSNELLHVYWAQDLTPGRHSPDEDEWIEVERVPVEKALQWVFSGKIKDSKTIIALLAYYYIKNRP